MSDRPDPRMVCDICFRLVQANDNPMKIGDIILCPNCCRRKSSGIDDVGKMIFLTKTVYKAIFDMHITQKDNNKILKSICEMKDAFKEKVIAIPKHNIVMDNILVAIQTQGKQFADKIEVQGTLIDNNVAKLIDCVVAGHDKMAEGQCRMAEGQYRVADRMDNIVASQDKMTLAQLQMTAGQNKVVEGLHSVVATQNMTVKGLDNIVAAQNRMVEATNKISAGQLKMAQAQLQMAAGQNKIVKGLDSVVAHNKMVKVQDKVMAGQNKMVEGVNKIVAAQTKMVEAVNNIVASQNMMTAAQLQVTAGQNKIVEGLDNVVVTQNKMLEGMNRLLIAVEKSQDRAGDAASVASTAARTLQLEEQINDIQAQFASLLDNLQHK